MIKRRLSLAVLSVTMVVSGIFTLGAATANAAVLYDDNNYQGAAYYGENVNYVGYFNDRASSVTDWGDDDYYVYFEHANHDGRQVTLWGSYNSLSAISYNLHWWENWNDRISSFY